MQDFLLTRFRVNVEHEVFGPGGFYKRQGYVCDEKYGKKIPRDGILSSLSKRSISHFGFKRQEILRSSFMGFDFKSAHSTFAIRGTAGVYIAHTLFRG